MTQTISLPGSPTIHEMCRAAIAKAQNTFQPVHFEFHDVEVIARRDDDVEELVAAWFEARERRSAPADLRGPDVPAVVKRTRPDTIVAEPPADPLRLTSLELAIKSGCTSDSVVETAGKFLAFLRGDAT